MEYEAVYEEVIMVSNGELLITIVYVLITGCGLDRVVQ